ncbi:MAG TPA: aspartyl protease family protein [Pyrinomonadaceae bacterium]|nr:aspartyl protease family protein [Pyrinomonadaceae bacterium]
MMNHSLKNLACCAATSAFLFTLAATTWAVPLKGTAHLSVRATGNVPVPRALERETAAGKKERQAGVRLPVPVRFREASGRGLLLSVWINSAGPYTFAVDTGAGATILSRRVADEARVSMSGKRPLMLGGISGAGTVAGQEVFLNSLAAGAQDNILPSSGLVIVTERLAPGIDGVLDPTEAYWPLGFEIDMPRGELTAFDPRSVPLRRNQNLQPDGTIVSWLTDGQSRRPFVMLEGGRRALLDTGSGFGLAVTQEAAMSLGIMPGRGREHSDIRDLAGGSIAAHRVSPATISIGALVLRGIPTDLLPNARSGSPILLGRDALRPFRLAFDPVNRLIRIIPG